MLDIFIYQFSQDHEMHLIGSHGSIQVPQTVSKLVFPYGEGDIKPPVPALWFWLYFFFFLCVCFSLVKIYWHSHTCVLPPLPDFLHVVIERSCVLRKVSLNMSTLFWLGALKFMFCEWKQSKIDSASCKTIMSDIFLVAQFASNYFPED